MPGWTDNPLADFDRHEAEYQKWLESRPKCSICDEHIQEDHFYLIDGNMICPVCLNENFKVEIDD